LKQANGRRCADLLQSELRELKMLEIRALTYNDLKPVVPITGTISGNEGTVGRAENNTIVLPDPWNMLSRQHLQFSLQPDGTYKISNISEENAVFVNEEELKSNVDYFLKDQDKISVGGYVLEVRYVKQDKANSMSPASDVTTRKEKSGALLMSPFEHDSDGRFNSKMQKETKSDDDSFLDLFEEQEPYPIRGDPIRMLNRQAVELASLDTKNDELVNAKDNNSALLHELLSDPLSSSMQRLYRDDINDPLKSFDYENCDLFVDVLQVNKRVDVSLNVRRINVASGSELGGFFHLPRSDSSPPHQTVLETQEQPRVIAKQVQKTSAENSSILNMDQLEEVVDFDQFISGLLLSDSPESKMSAVDDVPMQPPVIPEEHVKLETISKSAFNIDIAESVQLPVLTDTYISDDEDDVPLAVDELYKSILDNIDSLGVKASQKNSEKLYQAFAEGLGVNIPNRTALDENFMRLLGQLIRNYTEGTLEMIAGRALIKQEVRANATVIAPKRNNPLKFSPNNEAALLYLLGKSLPGFMESVEAVQNAFVDLCAHQVGIISGVKTALTHVLDNFDPASIIDNRKRKSLLYKLPLWRKAQLWEEYVHHYKFTRENAKDNFQDFCGFVFLKAYMEAASNRVRPNGANTNKEEKK